MANGDDAFELKSILCVPIMDGDGHVIGVSQVINKLNERIFTDDDVAIIEVRISYLKIEGISYFLDRLFRCFVVWVFIILVNMKMLFV